MSEDTNQTEAKGRRVTIDLTPQAAREVDRLRSKVGLTTADMFRHALSLFRIYVEAKGRGEELCLLNPAKSELKTRIELPIIVSPPQGNEQWPTNEPSRSR